MHRTLSAATAPVPARRLFLRKLISSSFAFANPYLNNTWPLCWISGVNRTAFPAATAACDRPGCPGCPRADGRSRPTAAWRRPSRRGPERRADTARLVRPGGPAAAPGMRLRAGIVMRAAWRTSRSGRRQPQETAEPSTSLLPRIRPDAQWAEAASLRAKVDRRNLARLRGESSCPPHAAIRLASGRSWHRAAPSRGGTPPARTKTGLFRD